MKSRPCCELGERDLISSFASGVTGLCSKRCNSNGTLLPQHEPCTPHPEPRCSFYERHRRLILLGFVLLAATTLSWASWVAPSRGLAWYSGRVTYSLHLYFTPYYRGRSEAVDPSPRCCHGTACLPAPDTAGRHAVVTLLRTDQYLGLTQALACSLRRSNPGLPLIVLTAEGDLQPQTLQAVRQFGQLQIVPDFSIPNFNLPRFSGNWLKLRGWEMTEYDGLLMLDGDMMVDSNISWVFDLPTDFATVLDTDKLRALPKFSPMGIAQAGVLFFRPCAGVAMHMMQLAQDNYSLQYRYHDAEQTFLDWYFKFSRWTLPMEYNALVGVSHTLWVGGRNVTFGGAVPVVRHFSGPHKPWVENLRHCEAGVG